MNGYGYLVVGGWYLLGVLGWLMLYTERRYWKHSPRPWCPSPSEIFGGILFSVFGFALFVAGIIIWLTSDKLKGSWWDSPICKPKTKTAGDPNRVRPSWYQP